jgi:hypothetical protein
MKAISLKISEKILKAGDRYAQAMGLPRAEYIRRAIEKMNDEMAQQARAKRLASASRKVREQSMRVNAEFSAIERDIDD